MQATYTGEIDSLESSTGLLKSLKILTLAYRLSGLIKGTWKRTGFSEVFCINRLGRGPLNYISSRSDFGFEFSEIFVFEKRLPDSTIRGVGDSPYQRYAESATLRLYGESFFEYEYLREPQIRS